MPDNNSLIKKISHEYPGLQFSIGEEYRWSHRTQTITYPEIYDPTLLLHEVAHAVLGHDTFALDITLLKKEREAWEYVESVLAKQYNVAIPPNQREDALDTYREWLHTRSLCTVCKITAIQQKTGAYQCSTCQRQWRVARSVHTRVYRMQLN